MRRAARKDDNHNAIAEVFESCGAFVIDTSGLEGFVDIVVLWRGAWHLVEVKDGRKPPSSRELTGKQVILHAKVEQHSGKIHVIENETQALALLGAKRTA